MAERVAPQSPRLWGGLVLVSVCAPKLFADGLPCAASAPVSRASLEDALCRGVGRQGLSPGVRAGGAFGRGVEPGGQPLQEARAAVGSITYGSR